MRSLKIGTRLLVFLLPSIGLIMAAFAAIGLRERGRVLRKVAATEATSFANALRLAFWSGQGGFDRRAVTQALSELTPSPAIFGVRAYDTTGVGWFSSLANDPLPPLSPSLVDRAVRADTAVVLDSPTGAVQPTSVLRAIRSGHGEMLAILEVAVSPEHFAVEMGVIRMRFLVATLAILACVTLVTLWLVRRVVTNPLGELLAATRALSRGDLTTRVPEHVGRGELEGLVRELNQMAANLDAARRALVHENNERLRLERTLRASQQLATVGRLAAGLAHEIAAPLNVISGRAEMLLASAGARGDDARGLRIIVAQIRRITAILKQVLTSARQPEARRQPIELDRVLDGVEEFLETELAAVGVAVERSSGEPAWVEADPDQLHQVFVNLYLNAIQSLEQSPHPRRLQVAILIYRSGAEPDLGTLVAEVVLADNGPGIAADILPTVFDPFVTTKPAGSGLGLGMAKGLIEAHGGTIVAGNRAEGGAEFRVSLPAILVPQVAHA